MKRNTNSLEGFFLLKVLRQTVLLHVIGWCLIILIPSYIIAVSADEGRPFPYHIYYNLAVYGLLFYLNYAWFVPCFFFKGKWLPYFFLAFSGIVLAGSLLFLARELTLFDFGFPRKPDFPNQLSRPDIPRPGTGFRWFLMVSNLGTSLLVLGFSLGLKLLEKVRRDEKTRKELEKEKLNAELAFLKNQISPHFFFNTLNNIYSLIGNNVEAAKDSVHKLSKLMRYLLYESEKEKISLTLELEFLKNYIDLMKLRVTERVKLSFSFPAIFPEIKIPPLLFIPFVENAFKHGISYRNPSFIDIRLKVEEGKVVFNTRNSMVKETSTENKNYYGIGLDNVKKRLDLLFRERYQLTITEKEDEYLVDLILETTHEDEHP